MNAKAVGQGTASMKLGLRALIVLALGAAIAGCDGNAPSGDSGHGPESQAGRLVIIGGGLQAETTEVYQAVLDGRMGQGPVCIFPTASAEPEESMATAISRFDAVGGEGTAEGIFLTVDNPADAALPETVSRIESCSGFYFVGGQQSRIVRVFRPEDGDSPAYHALFQKYLAGAVVSGSSAGAAIMNDPMIGGGSSLGAITAGVRGPDGEEGVMLQKGMGFLEGTLVDQHFLARGRWARLLVAVLATDGFDFGMGIDENTALVVDGNTAWVAGASGIVFFDTREAVRDGRGHAGSNVMLNLLGAGDQVDLTTGAIRVPGSKGPTEEAEGAREASEAPEARIASILEEEDGIFERWALLRFLAAYSESEVDTFTFSQDNHTFGFEKGPEFRSVSSGGQGVEGLPNGLSVGPLRLRVTAKGDG